MIAADPQGRRLLAVVDKDAPDIGRARQLIFGVLAAGDVEPGSNQSKPGSTRGSGS